MDNKEQLKERIEYLLAKNAKIEAKYGTGVRPSWVSADIGMNCIYIGEAQKELEILCSESPCDDWSGGFGKGKIIW
jgi:hypothetical protein